MRRCDDICAFTVCFCCFVKSHRKLFPFCCLFRGKVRLKKNFSRKKRTFFSPRRLRIPRGIHGRRRRRKKREKTTREKSFVAETERLKSSDRPRCGPGIGVASRGYFSIECSYFMHFSSSSDKKNSHKNRAKNHLTFLLESNLK